MVKKVYWPFFRIWFFPACCSPSPGCHLHQRNATNWLPSLQRGVQRNVFEQRRVAPAQERGCRRLRPVWERGDQGRAPWKDDFATSQCKNYENKMCVCLFFVYKVIQRFFISISTGHLAHVLVFLAILLLGSNRTRKWRRRLVPGQSSQWGDLSNSRSPFRGRRLWENRSLQLRKSQVWAKKCERESQKTMAKKYSCLTKASFFLIPGKRTAPRPSSSMGLQRVWLCTLKETSSTSVEATETSGLWTKDKGRWSRPPGKWLKMTSRSWRSTQGGMIFQINFTNPRIKKHVSKINFILFRNPTQVYSLGTDVASWIDTRATTSASPPFFGTAIPRGTEPTNELINLEFRCHSSPTRGEKNFWI